MTEEDFRVAGEVIRKALDEGQQGRSYEWKNPATGASGSPASSPGVSASPAVHKTTHRLDIRLKATQNCWVQLTRSNGRTIFAGTVYAGSTMTWTEHHAVQMTLGNPSGVKVFVNGKSSVPRGTVSMITLSLHAGTAH